MKNFRAGAAHLLVETADRIIRVYQKVISPDHGIFGAAFGRGHCRFHPSCSEYAREAQRQYGLSKGSMLSLKRIFRCHPWHEGGYDPIPTISDKLQMTNEK